MTILLNTYGKPELTTIDCDDAPGRYGSGRAGDSSRKWAGLLACCFPRQRMGPIMIDLKTDDGIPVVTIAHGKANALDIDLCKALVECFEELRASVVRAVVITGQGRMFSAGVDLVRVSSGGADYVRAFLPILNRAFDALFFLPKPVVAAVNGHAIAGGCVLTCCADRRLMARGVGRIGVTELLVGVPFPALAFEILRAAVPARPSSRVHARRRDLRCRRGPEARLGR
jgi:enoyl-CoA hydratase/carnithine racemase